MKTITVGLMPAPELPTKIIYKLKDSLKSDLENTFPDNIYWKVDIQIDRLTGAANTVTEIMNEVAYLKEANSWDYAISFTDLPIFHEKGVVIADVDEERKIAQISLPAFGITPTAKKVKFTLIHIIKELHYRNLNTEKDIQFTQKGIGIKEKPEKSAFFNKLIRAFRFSNIQRLELSDKEASMSVRFLIHQKWSRLPILLLGMTIANRPWAIMSSFKKVIGLAFATGAYMLVFTTIWQLSSLYGLIRYLSVMVFAVGGMTAWTIFAHNLWEKRHNAQHSNNLRLLYNLSTVFTLLVSTVLFYISLFMLFLFAVFIFVPPDMFSEVVNYEVGWTDYLSLVWLVSSAATVAGAIGAGLEDDDLVKTSTYSYRQYIRLKTMEKENEDNEQ